MKKRIVALLLAGTMIWQNTMWTYAEDLLMTEVEIIDVEEDAEVENTTESILQTENVIEEQEYGEEQIIDCIEVETEYTEMMENEQIILNADVPDTEELVVNTSEEEIIYDKERVVEETEVLDATVIAVSSDSLVSGDYVYTISENGATITNYTGTDEKLIIPSYLDGYAVTSIGDDAFEYTSLTEIEIPDSVTEIGDYAFGDCEGLKSVKLSSNLKKIGYEAFENCKALTEITIPKSLEQVNCSFENTGIKKVSFEEGITTIIPGLLFGAAELTQVEIPEGVTEIGDSAFSGCSGLESVTIPSTVTSIGYSAFRDCEGLKSVKLSSNLKKIGYEAFENCKALTEITIPKSLERVSYSFRNTGIKEVSFEEGITTIIPGLLSGAAELTQVEIPEGVTEIGVNAFASCSGLESVTIPSTVTSIGSSAFANCTSLTEVEIPDSVTSIGSSAFFDCPSLTEIEIPDSVTSIGSDAFAHCTSLTEVEIPDSVTKIGGSAFEGCTSLTEVEIPDSVTAIGYGAFRDCEGLSIVKISKSVAEIGTNAFSGCPLLSIYGYADSYAETYANDNNIPFVVLTDEEAAGQQLLVEATFDDKAKEKSLSWTDTGYSEDEIKVNIAVSAFTESITVSEIDVDLENLKMFKVKESSKVTNQGMNYHYSINADQTVLPGETVTFQLTLVKKGLTWWKPNDAYAHSGIINVTVTGEKNDGSKISSNVSSRSQLTINYQNDVKIQKQIEDEEKAAQEAISNADSSAENVTDEFADLSDKMILDPKIESYIGHDQFEALKMLIYTEISLANISKSYFTSAGLSDKVAERMMEKFLGYETPQFGIAEKTVPIEVVVLGNNNKQYQFRFDCNVTLYLLAGVEFGINGNIKTQMWQVSKPNQKLGVINCADGVINQGNLSNFSKAVWSVAQLSLQSAYKNVWGNDADKLANGIIENSTDSIASKAAKYGLEKPVQIVLKKFYEKKLKSQFSESFFKLLIYPSKMAVVQCPVDVYVYNSENTLMGSIINDQVTINGEGVVLWTEGDDKYVQLFDDSYQVIYKATGTGTMNLNIYDQMVNNTNYRNCEFSLVPLSEGVEYSQSINNELLTNVDNYKLTSNMGTTIGVSMEETLYTDTYPTASPEQSTHSHTWDSGEITKQATCAANGVKSYSCKTCGALKTESVSKTTSHTWDSWITTSAATVFAAEAQERRCIICNLTQMRAVGSELKPTMKVNATTITLKTKQSTTGLRITNLAAGDSIVSMTLNSSRYVKISKVNLKKGTCKLTALKKKDSKATTKLTVKLKSGLTKVIPIKVQTSAVKTTGITGVEKKLTMKVNGRVTLKPILTPFTSKEPIKYSTSNKKVVKVSSKGVLTAVKPGTAKITIKAGKKKFVCTVKVKSIKNTGVKNVPATLALKVKKSKTLKPVRVPSNSTDKITYKSSNTKVATVNSKGKITAKKKGTAKITVKCGSGVAICKVTVK